MTLVDIIIIIPTMSMRTSYVFCFLFRAVHIECVLLNQGSAWGFCCISGAEDIFANNSVVLRDDGGYSSNCNLPPGTDGMKVMNNAVFVPSGKINGNGKVCGVMFDEWQSKGNDPGTTMSTLPSDDEIIKMAKVVLDDGR